MLPSPVMSVCQLWPVPTFCPNLLRMKMRSRMLVAPSQFASPGGHRSMLKDAWFSAPPAQVTSPAAGVGLTTWTVATAVETSPRLFRTVSMTALSPAPREGDVG